jgi:hypothetical protein
LVPAVVTPPAPPADGEHSAPAVAKAPAPSGPGTVHFVTEPWAEIYVDGQKRGNTPVFRTAQLTPGKHQVRLVNPSFPAAERTVDVKAGKETTLTVRFARP